MTKDQVTLVSEETLLKNQSRVVVGLQTHGSCVVSFSFLVGQNSLVGSYVTEGLVLLCNFFS